jgi:hypothetical protein
VLGFEIGGLDPDQSRITLSSMPKGPRGQKAPADVIGAAIMTARIATGEIEESLPIALKCALSPDAKPYVASHHQPRTAFEIRQRPFGLRVWEPLFMPEAVL